jgi:SagB-type dehydrogenase family enzyme
MNKDISFAWKYHNATKHSPESVRSSTHFLDWPNQPRPYKVYRSAGSVTLPDLPEPNGCPALAAITRRIETPSDAPVSLDDLTSILYFSAGITRRRKYPGGEFMFRAAACTGALYSIEIYLICGEAGGVEPGVYLFSPHDLSLKHLRTGDYRGVLVRATAGEPSVQYAPVILACTGTYWRNSWKYQARTYRHFGWDNGTIIANMLAVSAARGFRSKVVHGFVDAEVNRLLGIDPQREVALNLVTIGRSDSPTPQFSGDIPPIEPEILPYSRHEVDYPAMREMHAASSLATPAEVAAWRGAPSVPMQTPRQNLVPLDPLPPGEMIPDSIEEVIRRRGSSRRFARQAISYRQLSVALQTATSTLVADFLEQPEARLNDLYLIAHAVDGLPPGAYLYHPGSSALELLRPGVFRREAGFLGLEQDLPADCSAAVFFLADLGRILERFGNRGYRACQLEAGILGGRLYLSAYTQRLGATGLTFYDDDVVRFFAPHSDGKNTIFLVALGRTERIIQGS